MASKFKFQKGDKVYNKVCGVGTILSKATLRLSGGPLYNVAFHGCLSCYMERNNVRKRSFHGIYENDLVKLKK